MNDSIRDQMRRIRKQRGFIVLTFAGMVVALAVGAYEFKKDHLDIKYDIPILVTLSGVALGGIVTAVARFLNDDKVSSISARIGSIKVEFEQQMRAEK